MIQIQLFCDGCKSNVSVVCAADRGDRASEQAHRLLDTLHETTCKEMPDGEGQATSDREADAATEPAKRSATSGPH